MADLSPDELVRWFAIIVAFVSALLIAMLVYRERAQLALSRGHHCRVCGYDLRGGSECCPECGTPTVLADTYDPLTSDELDAAALTHDWPGNPIQVRLPAGDPTPAPLHGAPSAWAADLLCQQLRARGIAASISRRDRIEQMGGMSRQASGFIVTVPEGDLNLAREILKHFLKQSAPTG
jgi:hypothetical protein